MDKLPSYLKRVRNHTTKEVNGIQVDFTIRGTRYRKSFNYIKCGGEDIALEQAVKHRDALCIEHNYKIKPKKEPTSDIAGVSRTEYSEKSSSGKMILKAKWQATWQSEPGKQVTRRFSIHRHGEEKAKALAIEARNHAINAIQSGRDPIFKAPKYKYAKLWRYMDFTKFISMLENSGIFFAQADLLGDPFEGSYSRGNEKIEILFTVGKKTLKKKSTH